MRKYWPIESSRIVFGAARTSRKNRYGMKNTAPPFLYRMYGNRQMHPKPTQDPNMLNQNSRSVVHLSFRSILKFKLMII